MRLPLRTSAGGRDALRADYEDERSRTLRRRLPLVVVVWAFWTGFVLLCEHAWFPDRARVMLTFYLQDLLVCSAAVGLLYWPPAGDRARAVAAAMCAWMVSRASWYAARVGLPGEVLALVQVAVLAQLPVVLPWGVGPQLFVVAAGVGSAAAALLGLPATAATYVGIALFSAAATSVFGAHAIEDQRWRAYRRARREADERDVASALVRVGETLSAQLDRRDLLRRVNQLAVRLLDADWCGTWVLSPDDATFHLAATGVGGVDDPASLDVPASVVDAWWPVGRDVVDVADVAHDPRLAALHRRTRIVSAVLMPIVHAGHVTGFVVAGTHSPRHAAAMPRHRRLAEGVAHATAVALNNVRRMEELEAANRVKAQFVAAVSHELRTPLNVIAGYAELLEAGDSFGPLAEPAQRDAVARIRRSAEHLRELVDQTLVAGRLEAQREIVRREAVDVGALARQLAGELQPRVPPGVRVVWTTPDAGAAWVLVDFAKLKIILRNLIGNALKFTEAGTVDVRMRVEQDRLLLVVRDTGIGIAEADQPAIFEMFHQVDPSPTRRHGGVGLGLHVVARLVRLLDGRVEVESAPGKGSCFTVVLPVTREASAVVRDAAEV